MKKKTQKLISSSMSIISLAIMLILDTTLIINSVHEFMKPMGAINIFILNMFLSLVSFVGVIWKRLIE